MCTKSKIRDIIKNRLLKLSETEKSDQSDKLNMKLKELSIEFKTNSVLVYLPLPDEIDITDYIYYLFDKNINVYAPVTQNSGNMEFYKLSKTDMIIENRGQYNIIEPLKSKPYFYHKDDTIIVPLRAFDDKGHRLGRGKGYYDRFLGKFPMNTIGVAYNEQLINGLITEIHDIPLNYIITERFDIKK